MVVMFRKGLLLVLSALWCVAMFGCLGIQVAAQQGSEPVSEGMFLPIEVEGTALTAVEMVAFEGPFWEDGSGREVVDAAGMLLRNHGVDMIKTATVVLEQRGRTLRFTVTCLPPGETALVVEERAQPYLPGEITRCYGSGVTGAQWVPGIRTEQRKDHTIRVINDTDSDLSGLRLHFKSHHGESGVYIGGISYSVEIGILMAGESVILSPFRYVSGYSRVVAVTQE